VHEGRLIDCGVSVGASIASTNREDSAELLKKADVALYAAKVGGRGRIAIFKPSMRAEMQKRSSMISLARQAVQDDLIVPHYQPKVELASGKLLGFEALLRWRHPVHGIQPPSSIAAAFEDLELAGEISSRMIRAALADMRRWRDFGIDFGHVAINASAADLKQKTFADGLLEQLAANGLPPGALQVEVTETVFLGRGAEYVEHALKTLSDAGVRIALDDFGTGYASLSHLKQFRVDIVKIDRSFVQDLPKDSHNTAMIGTILDLGRSLDLQVIAEGVETEEQEKYLVSQGCLFAQGFLYGKATPAARIPGMIRSWGEIASEVA
jgi:EAL domain-containing protein (putative c-di-GMP-specific phosphodiesterase class I)